MFILHVYNFGEYLTTKMGVHVGFFRDSSTPTKIAKKLPKVNQRHSQHGCDLNLPFNQINCHQLYLLLQFLQELRHTYCTCKISYARDSDSNTLQDKLDVCNLNFKAARSHSCRRVKGALLYAVS